jgi:O-antigen ligase
MPDTSRWSPLLERVALFLAVLGIMLRWLVSGSTAGTGLNLFVHSLFWIGLAAWFAARALEGGASYRFTGTEIAMLAFAIACWISVLRASFKLAALDYAAAYLSYGVLFVLAVHSLGTRLLLRLLMATLFTLSLYALVQRFYSLPRLHETYDPSVHGALTQEFAARLASYEVFATFLYPNVFAGFLVLTLPVAAGMLLDLRGRGPRALGLKAATLALGLLALAFTGALGGWAACLSGAAAFGALAATRTRGRTAVVAGGGAAALLLAVLLIGPLLAPLAAKSHAMHVRSVYWEAARKTFATAPLLGVGLNNFQDHYTRHKSDVQQETVKAHNDYLQLAAETGILGILALAGLLGIGLRRALARQGAPPAADEPSSPPGIVAGAVVTAFFLAYMLRGTFDDIRDSANRATPVMLVLVLASWVGYWRFARADEEAAAAGPLAWTRIGVAAGIVALLVHMLVDFDFYEMGVAMTLFLALALAALLRARPPEWRLPRGACLAAAGILLLVAFPVSTLLIPPLLAADAEVDEASRVLRRAERASHEGAVDTPALSEALRLARAAQEHNPFDPEAYDLYARAQFLSWQLMRRAARKDDERAELTLRAEEGMVLDAIENAIRLQPGTAAFHARKAYFHRDFRYFLQRRADELGASRAADRPRAEALSHLRHAREHMERAVALYPTSALYQYELGRVLDLSGDGAAAGTRYRRALELHEKALQEQERLARLQLPAPALARCLRSAGKPYDSHEALKAHLQAYLAGSFGGDTSKKRQAVELFQRHGSLPDLMNDELDDMMKREIEDALNAIMRALPENK